MRLLIVEDEHRMAAAMQRGLVHAGFTVDVAGDGVSGLEMATTVSYDVIVLDVMLPGLSGYEVTRQLRARQVWTPILLASAKDGDYDQADGLDLGADDYLTKPFSFAELVARLHALIRRAGTTSPAFVLTYADVTLDLRTRRVERGGKSIHLQAKEFILLEYLMRNPERVLGKAMILEHVWEYGFDPQTNVVDVLVSRLRAKLDRDFPTRLIHTLRGAGYVLRTDPP
jgi:DNA-binding response OmpR family regulator